MVQHCPLLPQDLSTPPAPKTHQAATAWAAHSVPFPCWAGTPGEYEEGTFPSCILPGEHQPSCSPMAWGRGHHGPLKICLLRISDLENQIQNTYFRSFSYAKSINPV